MTKVSRRFFLVACLATTVLAGVPASALGTGSTRALKTVRGASMALGKKIAGAHKALLAQKPTSTPPTKVEFKARARNLTSKINTLARARAAAATSAGAVAAEEKALAGLVGGMSRLAFTRFGGVFRAITLVGVGISLFGVGQTLWDAYMGQDTPKDDCDVGTTCRKYNADGSYEIRYTSNEYASSQSSWSLSGTAWYAYKNVSVAAANGAKAYYRVHWVWRPGNGRTAESFEPSTDLYPYTKGVALTTVEEKLRSKGLLDKALTKADIAAIVDTAVAGAIANDASDWPDSWNTTSGPPKLDPSEISDTVADSFSQQLGSLFDPWDGTVDMFDPDVVAESASDGMNDDGSPGTTPGTTPTPTPTPTSGTGTGSGGTSTIDWGAPPTGTMPTAPTPFSWVPTPWQVPDLPGQCAGVPYNFTTVFRGASGTINPCPVIAQARPIVRPVAVVGWTGYAVSQFLDL